MSQTTGGELVSFPTLAAYLDRLPAGLASHPECRAKASIYLSAFEGLEPSSRYDELPQELVGLLRSPPPSGTWVPEVVNNALHLALCDIHFDSDADAFVVAAYRANQRLFSSRMYRLLMAVVTPTMTLKSARSRWGAFHDGTPFDLSFDDTGAHVTLSFPEYLHDPIMLRCFAEAFRAAVEAAHGKDVSVVLEATESNRATYVGRWR